MPDYSLGKVYKIVGNGKIYVGSTTSRRLSKRFAVHRCHYKNHKEEKGGYVTSFECFDDPECRIELLETYPCDSKDELEKCERKWIEALDCVNKVIPSRTRKEYRDENKEQIKEYREQHKDDMKQYYQQHKEEKIERQKQYYQQHKEEKKEYDKTYRQQNKEKAKEYYHKNKEHINQQCRERRQRKLLASNNSITVLECNLSVEVQSQELNLIVEHE
jgi:flagellar biosynthesis GTPase FlhF